MSTNMTLIETKTVGAGGATDITFSSIPSTYTDLLVTLSLRSDRAGTTDDDLGLTINGVTTNRTWRVLYGTGSTAGSDNGTNTLAGTINASTSTASTFGNTQIYFPNYASSNYKSFSSDSVFENNATAAKQFLLAGLWSSTSAITTLKFNAVNGNLVEYSTASLYGISNVTSTTKATGGIVSSDGTYNYHMFPYSGTFTPTQNITADYLVIAGGGGGGRENFDSGIGGGGGAGGLRSTVGATGGGGSLESAVSLTASTAYTVTVGAGGASRTTGGVGNNGSNSSIAGSGLTTITSTGGGGGGGGVTGAGNNFPGQTGGSGGGGQGDTQGINGGTGTTNQGYAGGAANNGGEPGGGAAGGGGAGEAGNTDGFGEGGDGVAISAFANATQTGVNTYYAGGGGGANYTFTASGGLGGGGTGGRASTSNAISGTINTGSGGGGGGNDGGFTTSGAGGSGLVIIRYAI